ncbi:MAG: hypothetical protein K2Y29_00455 [Beijerinckiaceae bacterium]|nr:hypothetical protein [Beijerinckiaceae bacterium]
MMWTVPPLWKGETVFIIAGGPSVARQNVESLRGRRVIVINSSWQAAPWAEFLFFGDRRWFAENEKRLAGFAGAIVTCAPNTFGPRVRRLRKMTPPPGLSQDPTAVVMGRTSLHAAMNFAAHLGVERMVLLGVDMQAEGDRSHHHAPHPWPQKPGCWDQQMHTLRSIVEPLKARGIEVWNTSDVSQLEWWPRESLDACLSRFPA